MAFLSSLNITGSALTATKLRMDVISENIANSDTTRTSDGDPYCRKMVVYQEAGADTSFRARLFESLGIGSTSSDPRGVIVVDIIEDETEFTPVYNPSHPDSDEDGYVWMPNVDSVEETLDMMAATRAYDANITAFNAVKAMASRALEIR